MKLRELKKKQTRENIQKAARAIFAQKGYSGATTSEIAAKAGIAEGTLFNYFKSKGELFLSVMLPDTEAESYRPKLRGQPTPETVADEIVRMIDHDWSGLAVADRKLLREYVSVAYGNDVRENGSARESLLMFDGKGMEKIRLFLDRLHVDPQASQTAAHCICGSAVFMFSLFLFDDRMEYGEMLDEMRTQIAFILAGHVPAAKGADGNEGTGEY